MEREKTIGYVTRSLSNMLKRCIDNSDVKKEVDNITGIHFWVIGYLYDHRNVDVFQKDFENSFNIRRSTATEIINVMEKRGLVERVRVDNDKRLRKLILTEKSIEYHHKFTEYIESFEKEIIRGIPEEELQIFFSVIEKIKNNIIEKEGQVSL